MKENAGIDYGMGMSNIDNDTNIRYGVISMHEVVQSWADSSEPYYGHFDNDTEYDDNDMTEPLSFFLEDNEYTAEQSADDTDIFITKSPYYTLCSFCSPCAPGAGYIMDQDENGVKAYCFGHDWFEDGKAPYKVYDVKTDKEVI